MTLTVTQHKEGESVSIQELFSLVKRVNGYYFTQKTWPKPSRSKEWGFQLTTISKQNELALEKFVKIATKEYGTRFEWSDLAKDDPDPGLLCFWEPERCRKGRVAKDAKEVPND